MGKVETGIYFCVTADILTNFTEMFLGVVLYQLYEFGHGNRKAKFSREKKKKNIQKR